MLVNALEERVASVFVLLYQQLRQSLYFCTSQPAPSQQRAPALVQYLYYCTSSCVSICTVVLANLELLAQRIPRVAEGGSVERRRAREQPHLVA